MTGDGTTAGTTKIKSPYLNNRKKIGHYLGVQLYVAQRITIVRKLRSHRLLW